MVVLVFAGVAVIAVMVFVLVGVAVVTVMMLVFIDVTIIAVVMLMLVGMTIIAMVMLMIRFVWLMHRVIRERNKTEAQDEKNGKPFDFRHFQSSWSSICL